MEITRDSDIHTKARSIWMNDYYKHAFPRYNIGDLIEFESASEQ